MADWMNQMVDAVDEAEASNTLPPEEVPTEPATSPRSQVIEVPVNDGRWTAEEYAQLLWYIAQDLNARDQAQLQVLLDRQQAQARAERLPDMETERQRAEAAEHEAHQRSITEWEAKIQAKELDNAALPSGPTPQGVSSMRELPRVHEALRQNDPKVTAFSQPCVKKAPPTLGRPRPAAFYSGTEPPRIGSEVQPPPPAAPRPAVVPSVQLPLAATPMTPSHPPRPPLSALPKHPSMEASPGANKHPLEPPTAQAPPSKHVRCKPFPKPSQQLDQVYVAASATVEMPQPGRPCPKGPPAEYMPTPPEIASIQPSSYEDDRRSRLNDKGLYLRVKSNRDIEWSKPLWEQLVPVLRGGPSPDKSPEELRTIRAKVPELSNSLLKGIFPADNTIIAVQKNHGVHKIHMAEPAAWVLNGTHWFSLLQQPMMIVIWCHNWEDGSKFQYLMQILQAHYGDYVPRYQIILFDDSKIYGPCLKWQEPSTIWDGKPVIGFMAETFIDDLSEIGFKDFNPMWTFPTTAVNQCWEALTFGMPPWHIGKDYALNQSKVKDALQSQSPIAAFKSTNMLQALGIAYSKIVLPSGDSKGAEKKRTYCPTTWSHCYTWEYAADYADQLRQAGASSLLSKETTLLVRIQLSNKSQSHPAKGLSADSISKACAFADCASTVMCYDQSHPCIAPKVSRDCDLDASMSFSDLDDMIRQFNAILAVPQGFPQIPSPRPECQKPAERHW